MQFPTRAALVAALAALLAGPALAEPSRLQVIVGGEAYDGPPRFEVTFDGEPLGERAVASAIDTASAGRFADAADRGAYVEAFDFEIPEAIFKPLGEVRLRLVNEAFGGEGSGRDRNLFVAAVAVNGRAVTISGFATATAAGVRDNEVLGEFLVLGDGTVEAVSVAPDGGWPQPSGGPAVVVEAAPQPATPIAPAAAPPPAAATLETAAAQEPEPASPAPAPRIPVIAPEAAAPAPPAEVVTAALPAEAAISAGACPQTFYNVLGFNENSNDVTPRIVERLEQVLADIGTRRCTILVTGYSSIGGAHDTNALFALERAQNVLTYLRGRDVPAARMTASGGGATDRFGPTPADNRRVVITLSP